MSKYKEAGKFFEATKYCNTVEIRIPFNYSDIMNTHHDFEPDEFNEKLYREDLIRGIVHTMNQMSYEELCDLIYNIELPEGESLPSRYVDHQTYQYHILPYDEYEDSLIYQDAVITDKGEDDNGSAR